MIELEEQLKVLMLKNIEFQLNGKSYKKGKVKVFNTKQFFIKFKLETPNDIREYELPYPYRVEKLINGFLFDYCLSAFIPKTEESFWKMKTMDTSESSKLHDNYLYIITEPS